MMPSASLQKDSHQLNLLCPMEETSSFPRHFLDKCFHGSVVSSCHLACPRHSVHTYSHQDLVPPLPINTETQLFWTAGLDASARDQHDIIGFPTAPLCTTPFGCTPSLALVGLSKLKLRGTQARVVEGLLGGKPMTMIKGTAVHLESFDVKGLSRKS